MTPEMARNPTQLMTECTVRYVLLTFRNRELLSDPATAECHISKISNFSAQTSTGKSQYPPEYKARNRNHAGRKGEENR